MAAVAASALPALVVVTVTQRTGVVLHHSGLTGMVGPPSAIAAMALPLAASLSCCGRPRPPGGPQNSPSASSRTACGRTPGRGQVSASYRGSPSSPWPYRTGASRCRSARVVAELLGHARLDQTRRYTLPTSADRRRAVEIL